jgi:two-component system, LytTR family, response regulator
MTQLPLKAVIVDDESAAIKNLESLLSSCQNIHILATTTKPLEALSLLVIHQPDVLFLDIQMPSRSGFEVVSDLHQAGLYPEIVFVTGFDTFAIEAIKLSVFDYLVKPVEPDELTKTLNRLTGKKLESERKEHFQELVERTVYHANKLKFSALNGFFFIPPEDILYIQAEGSYSTLYSNSQDPKMITMNIGKMEEILPGHLFHRINRSVIVNISYLSRVDRKKRLVILEKDKKEYSFKIPLLHIREIENWWEKNNLLQQ